MSSFGGLILTNRGRNLQSKAQTGVPLQYTRIGIGDGYLGTTPILDLNALRNQVKSLNITKLKNLGNGRAVVGTVLSNQDMVEGFYFRELGVFAQDPDLGEILYCYGNAGNLAEYISPGGGPDIIEKSIDVQTIVGNAQNISAVIDDSLVYATKLDLENIQFPVTSVNSKTGDLTLTAEEIGAETPSGAQAKANAAASAALNAANNYTDQEATETRGIIGLLTNLTTRIKTSIVNAINGLQADFNEHKAEKVHQGEIHGLKLNAEKELEYFDGVEWKASDWKNIDLNTWAGVQKVVRGKDLRMNSLV